MEQIRTKTAGGITLPVLGFGTYKLGGHYELEAGFTIQDGAKIIRQAYECGYRHFDTASRYVYGKSEEMIGLAIKSGLPREEIFVTSKVPGNRLKYNDVIAECQDSLKRLHIKQLDLYLIHWPNEEVPLSETVRAMDWLLENEYTKYIGVSNFRVELLQEAVALTKYKISNNQIHYNLSSRGHEDAGTLKFCQDNDILVTAYSPLKNLETKENIAKSENQALKNLAKKHQATPAQIVLAWLYAKPNVVTIAKSEKIEHIKENFDSLQTHLTNEDIESLQSFPRSETRFAD